MAPSQHVGGSTPVLADRNWVIFINELRYGQTGSLRTGTGWATFSGGRNYWKLSVRNGSEEFKEAF